MKTPTPTASLRSSENPTNRAAPTRAALHSFYLKVIYHHSIGEYGRRAALGSKRCLARISKTLDHYLPDILVIQDTSPQGARRAQRITDLNAAIADLAKGRDIPVYAYSRDQARSAFAYLGFLNKQIIAELIAKHIPAFEQHVPPPRKPWMSEDARMGLFDAAALGLVFFCNETDEFSG